MTRIGSTARRWLAVMIIGLAAGSAAFGQASPLKKPVPVRVERSGPGFRLSRGGQPYLIKGGGGDGSLKSLAEAGGNSVRTWGVEGVGAKLDEAERLGLTVTVGIWLGHERHGFNYNDADQVFAQFEMARQAILKYKDHPALLMWGIGNEMEGSGRGDNAAIWSAINNIATLAHQLDPDHPTMTVLAEIGGDKVKNIHRLCPAIDVVGINSYGPVATVPGRYREAGGSKPFVLTEFGPAGAWETPKNAWGVAAEPSSTANAESYRRAWLRTVAGSNGLALGGYAFIWGHKQEATATWFGMLLPDGSRLGAVDAMTELWTGQPPANRCPTIDALTLEGTDRVEPGATVRARLNARDPEADPLQIRWVLRQDSMDKSAGGDAEPVPPTFPEAIVEPAPDHVVVKMPGGGGGYRLFAYVRDGKGGAAVANIPLFVAAKVEQASANRPALPLVLYDEAGAARRPFAASGWMGNTQGLTMAEDSGDRPHSGKSCIRVAYKPRDGWAGVVWQDPANDWGDAPGGYDLKGAKRLSFWARGEKGGEAVHFGLGSIGPERPFFDSARLKLEGTKLTRDWKRYTIDLGAADLSRIKSGFVFSLAGSATPTVFYLDDIVIE